MMGFTKKSREVSGERVDEGILFFTLIPLHPLQIVVKRVHTSSTQSPCQAAVHHI